MADERFVGTPRKATTHVNQNEDLIFEKCSPGKKGYRLAELDVPAVDAAKLLGDAAREDLGVMPELSEIEIIRHFTRLSTWNYAIDLGMYPLGSCTMKYNAAHQRGGRAAGGYWLRRIRISRSRCRRARSGS